MNIFQRIRHKVTHFESVRARIYFVIMTGNVLFLFGFMSFYIYLQYATAEVEINQINQAIGNMTSAQIRTPVYRAIGVARTISMSSDYLFDPNESNRDSIFSVTFSNLAKNLSYYNDKHLYESYFVSLMNAFVPNAPDVTGRTTYEQKCTETNLTKRFTGKLSESPREHTIEMAETKRMVTISDPYFAQEGGGSERYMLATIAAPILHKGQVMGSAGVEIPLVELQKILNNHELPKGASAYIVANNDVIIAHSKAGMVGQVLGNTIKNDELKAICNEFYQNEMEKVVTKVAEIGGVTHFITPIIMDQNNTTWIVGISIPNSQLYKNQYYFTLFGLLFITIALAVIAVVIKRFSAKIADPIIEVNHVVSKIARGEIKSINHLENTSTTEIGQIQVSINKLIDGLSKSAQFAEEIGKGNFEVKHDLLSENDDLGNSLVEMKASLLRAQAKELAHQEENKVAKWFSDGVAKFAEILRENNTDVKEFSYQVVSNLVKYVDAAQGGIYLQDEETPQLLEMKACFAYNRRKIMEKVININEGLVGRCFSEAESIYLLEVPNDYLSITSGLGDTLPTSLLLMPLKANNTVLGVIELASFHKMDENTIKFVEKVSESIAATLTSVRVNIKTARLLEQTRNQSEEMAAAEEELRQNLEELQSTQEEMTRIQAEQQTLLKEYEMNSEMMSLIFKHTNNIFYLKDLNGKYIKVSNLENVIKTLHLGDAKSKTLADLLPADVAERMAADESNILKSGQPTINKSFKLPQGSTTREVAATYSTYPIKLKDGSIIGLFTILSFHSAVTLIDAEV